MILHFAGRIQFYVVVGLTKVLISIQIEGCSQFLESAPIPCWWSPPSLFNDSHVRLGHFHLLISVTFPLPCLSFAASSTASLTLCVAYKIQDWFGYLKTILAFSLGSDYICKLTWED